MPDICKICLNLIDPAMGVTVEHIFPQAIGGTLKLKPLCKPCNSYLGTHVDAYLTNHFHVLRMRDALNLRGNSGTMPNPYPKVVFKNGEDQPFHYDVQKKKPVRARKVFCDDKKLTVFSEANFEKAIAEVRKNIEMMRLPPLSDEQILERLELIDDRNHVEAEVPVDNVHYTLALIKIAYELAVLWLGDSYLDDRVADSLRHHLLDPNGEPFRIGGTIGYISPEQKEEWQCFNQPSTSHLAIMTHDKNIVAIKLRIFSIFHATVFVSESANRYPQMQDRFLAIDPVNGVKFQSALGSAFGRVIQVAVSILDL
jgi:hypothetical protein